ncbi:MAG: 50S ribosomal protein L10 [Nitrospirae bacterium]|nr:50S ribosomal protein L10 [Nitrospirota bacterium]
MGIQSGKQKKERVVQELNDKFTRARSVILTDFRGLNVKALSDIRSRLRNCGAEYKVVKNTLAQKAAEGTEAHQVKEYFSGTTGVVLSYSDIVTPVRTLLEYAGKLESLKIKIGILEGAVLNLASIKEIAILPSREVLLAKALGGIKSPLHGFAATLQGVLRGLVFALNAVKQARSTQEA